MAINFNQRHLEVNRKAVEGLTRMQSHVSRVRTSYWKANGSPFLLSEMVAKRMTDIEKAMCDVQIALDACQVELASENAIFEERLKSVIPSEGK